MNYIERGGDIITKGFIWNGKQQDTCFGKACGETWQDLLARSGGSEKSRLFVIVRRPSLLGLLGLLGQKHSLDVGEHTTLGDGHTGQELVQLLVVADGQLQMAGDDPGLLVVTGGVACQLKDLSGQVLHDGSQVDWGAGTDALGVVALPQEPVDAAHGELQTSTG